MSARLTDRQKKTLADLEAKDPATLTAGQRNALADLQAKRDDFDADQMDTTNARTTGANETSGGDTVYVFANLPTAQNFKLGAGVTITINGMPASTLKKPGGGFFSGGKFGVTTVAREDWEEVLRVYGHMRMFKVGLVFAADTLDGGTAQSSELGSLRHGYEQVDPASKRTKSTPATEQE